MPSWDARVWLLTLPTEGSPVTGCQGKGSWSWMKPLSSVQMTLEAWEWMRAARDEKSKVFLPEGGSCGPDSIHCTVCFGGLFLVHCLCFFFFNESLGISLHTPQICISWLLLYVCFLGFLCTMWACSVCGVCEGASLVVHRLSCSWACAILVPQPGIEPPSSVSPCVSYISHTGKQILYHWATCEASPGIQPVITIFKCLEVE